MYYYEVINKKGITIASEESRAVAECIAHNNEGSKVVKINNEYGTFKEVQNQDNKLTGAICYLETQIEKTEKLPFLSVAEAKRYQNDKDVLDILKQFQKLGTYKEVENV